MKDITLKTSAYLHLSIIKIKEVCRILIRETSSLQTYGYVKIKHLKKYFDRDNEARVGNIKGRERNKNFRCYNLKVYQPGLN